MTQPNPIVAQQVERILRRVRDLPSLPDLVNKIVQMLGKANSSASEIARLISFDPGLTSKVLRMVNSSAYGFQRQISSVQHAIMILGFTTVRGLVLSASILKLFERSEIPGIDFKGFWKHSIQTAIASRMLADYYKIPHQDDAFSAGMLHDIGKMILSVYFTEQYIEVIQTAKRSKLAPHGDAFCQIETDAMGLDHAEIGFHLAMRWKLPATFLQVIRYHHRPWEAEDASQLVYVVCLANLFSKFNILNHGVLNPDWIRPELLSFFNFDPEALEPLNVLFETVQAEMADVEESLLEF